MADILCFGELLIDFVPLKNGDKLKDVHQFQKEAGGAPANVSAAIAHLGGHVSMIGKVGADPFGDFLIETLRKKGVDTKTLLQTTEAKTALAFVSLDNDGERDFLFYREPSADMLFKPTDLQEEWFKRAAIFHFGSISLITNPVREATLQAIHYAKQNEMIISFDPNIRLPLWGDEQQAREAILGQVPNVDILKLSEEELAFLTGDEEELTAAKSLFIGSVKLVLVTKGEAGCAYYTKTSSGYMTAIKVKAVDTTGAGDAFVGGFLYRLAPLLKYELLQDILSDPDLLEMLLTFANVCGALTATRRGAISALPRLEDVQSLLKDQINRV
ncbi:PfkB family carbohydrate kinase [Halalkalibacterium halodurans]|uniref:PfkB family carbohydrate kinase n=1 Tax=Halalkalibacterium halodurans TaxID=86665 RepID=UPI002AA9FCB3|nr:PfkB family carbohydrate kinase [Halalkalibacterium halodurans]MDY7224159.1 PfkB family carbohydrate kinase [Halalkalibacterium halodurans]MDY7243444.1 PfkB family carbohydrate kinase [Halalkalibacterium halodurans]